jgi:tetratricopeptide (TPR) repeat protein/ribonuclease BN (tRNA processing enzyme)
MSKRRTRKVESFEGCMKKAEEFYKNKEYSNTVATLSKAITLNPKSVEAHFQRGRAFEALDKLEDALKDYNRAVKMSPRMTHVYIHRAFVYSRTEKYDKALKDLETISKLDPKHKIYCLINAGAVHIRKKQFDKALEYYTRALNLNPKNSYKAWIYNGMSHVYWRLGHNDKALENGKLATNLAPKFSLPFIGLGTIYAALEQNDKALENFLKALELEPQSLVGLLNLGIFYRKMKQYDKAIEILARAIEFHPTKTEGYFDLGILYEELRQYDKALEQYDKVQELNPKLAHIYTHKGIAYGNLNEYQESMRSFLKAISLDPKESVAYLNKGILQMDLGKYDAALRDFEEFIRLEPNEDWAYLQKGKTLCYSMNDKSSFKEKKKHERIVLNSFEKAERNAKDTGSKELIKWWTEFSKKYCNASAENKKRLRVFAEIYEKTIQVELFSKVLDEQTRMSRFLTTQKTLKSERFFQVLRRWNSFTPIIPEKSRSSLGGGYLFACDNQGIIIDPGYNFVENFIKCGYSLGDLNSIVLTHAHDDHTADFEPILSLMSKLEEPRKISLFTNLSASVKFSHLLAKNEDSFDNVEILNENQTHQITPKLRMKATKAIHADILTEDSARGLIFELEKEKGVYRLGITGDTKFFKGSAKQNGLCSFFENVDVLVLHLGSIHEKEFTFLEDDFEGHKYDGDHLGVRGIVNLIAQCRPKLAIISEFGEELKELRTDIAFKIDNCFENYDSSGRSRVIPGDIGLTILFNDAIKVRCEVCGASVRLEDITYTETQINDKIGYYCKNHNRQEIIGKLRKAEEKELRIRAANVGCSTDLFFPSPNITEFSH